MSIDCKHHECARRYDCQYVGHHGGLHGPFEVFEGFDRQWYWMADDDPECEAVGPFQDAAEAWLDATKLERLC